MTPEPCSNPVAVRLLLCCASFLAFAAPAVAASDHEKPTAPSSAPAPTPTPATMNVTWNVEYILWAPDCQQRVMIGINGEFPGPTIRARAGELISVTVKNKLHTEGLVIHWHGIRQVQGHKLEVVEADGNHVEPFAVNDIDLYSGESYSVLLRADQKPASYWISVGVRGRQPKTLPALALLNYANSMSKWPTGAPPETPAWDDVQRSKSFTKRIKARKETNQPPPATADRRIVMLNAQNMFDGHTKWSINNVSLALPPTPYLGAFYYGLQATAFNASGEAPETFPEDYDVMNPPVYNETTVGDRVYMLRHGSVVDVVLQNANMLRDGVSESHPWHLHGHDFWVLGYGDGRYDQSEDFKKLNTVDPPLRNTVVVFPHGWTAIRLSANNTGAWAFHCHIEPHLHMGMGVVFVEGMEKMRELDVPKEAMACGVVARTAAVPLSPALPRSPAPSPAP